MMDFSYPTWKQIGDKQEEIDTLHRENSIKLEQILNLEEILYNTRILDMEDGSPCWCCLPSHDESCTKAREATEPHWKK